MDSLGNDCLFFENGHRFVSPVVIDRFVDSFGATIVAALSWLSDKWDLWGPPR
jgi:hypothetical protein